MMLKKVKMITSWNWRYILRTDTTLNLADTSSVAPSCSYTKKDKSFLFWVHGESTNAQAQVFRLISFFQPIKDG